MNVLYSTVNSLRDRYMPASHTSTFRKDGCITPEEFIAAGDYLVHRFPTWSWADADSPSKRSSHLPPGKQYLVTRHVPCNRRLNDDFAGDAGHEEAVVEGGKSSDEDGWLRTGGLTSSQPLKVREVRTVDDSGNLGEREVIEDDDIPDMEDDEDDEAIIQDTAAAGSARCELETNSAFHPFSAGIHANMFLLFPQRETHLLPLHHVLAILQGAPAVHVRV